ncbi:MAG: cupin domain-containing protein [Hyphomicrobiaceae bacterium]
MTEPTLTFRQILDPVTPEEFFATYFQKKPLHIPGTPDKFARVCTWSDWNDLVNMTDIWSDRSFKMVLDCETLDAGDYCRPSASRDGIRMMRPHPPRVAALMQQGASIVLDLIEMLSPGIRATTEALQMAFATRVSCNAYCSQNQRQAFPSHFDSTEVIALHVEGRKTWRVYKGRFPEPLERPGYNHPSFSPEHHERAKGELLMEVELKPGDLLYLPKGVYHDALASSEACLHLSFGLTEARGLDFLQWLVGSLDQLEVVRQALPRFDDIEAHEAHVRRIAAAVKEVLDTPDMAQQFRAEQRLKAFENMTHIRMPGGSSKRYRVAASGVRLVRRGQDWQIVSARGKGACEARDEAAVRWVLERDHFDLASLTRAFEGDGEQRMLAILETLASIGVVEAL